MGAWGGWGGGGNKRVGKGEQLRAYYLQCAVCLDKDGAWAGGALATL